MADAHKKIEPGTGIGKSTGLPIRLMVVDDSVTARAVFTRIIGREDDLELTGLASTAEEALVKLQDLTVDVILLDLEMPGMGGLEALPQIIAQSRGAQIMVVSTLTLAGAEHTMTALSLGAADTSPKPQPGCFDEAYCKALAAKIRALGHRKGRGGGFGAVARKTYETIRRTSPAEPRILAIGASTGGIHALGQFFGALPRQIHMPILITQHLPESFLPAFANQMEIASGRKAVIAAAGMSPQDDEILIAPGAHHLLLEKDRGKIQVVLDSTPASSGCMPSVDPMFASLGRTYGKYALGVVLSGMGKDGTEGGRELVAAGGTILAQDEASCAVWGMPGSIAMAGLASAVLTPQQLAGKVAVARRVAA